MEFLSTLSLRRATVHVDHIADPLLFLSTLSLRRATLQVRVVCLIVAFLSTLSLRRATHHGQPQGGRRGISIHALLAESDLYRLPRSRREAISIHALLAESDATQHDDAVVAVIFLSTLSLRRATSSGGRRRLSSCYFYPRSPCGERPRLSPMS